MDETVKALLEQMKQQQERAAAKDVIIEGLLESIKNTQAAQQQVAVTVQPAVVDPDVVRAEKVQRLAMSMRKSNRIKVFKASGDSDIQIFIKKFGEELNTLK